MELAESIPFLEALLQLVEVEVLLEVELAVGIQL
jgi:hypothetical protein